MTGFTCEAVLFDLDGTVLDTAPDLLHALNRVRWRRGLPPMAAAGFRDQVARGARAMLEFGLPGFGQWPSIARAAVVQELLDDYGSAISRDTIAFPGMIDLLDALAFRDLPIGIVTNKPIALAEQLLVAMAMRSRFAIVLGGDSLTERKPHPMPVLEACRRLGVAPADTLFVGDDARDVAAGRGAGCRTVVVGWGYADPAQMHSWGADDFIASPGELRALIGW